MQQNGEEYHQRLVRPKRKQNHTPSNDDQCISVLSYAGHIFLLGLIALTSELVNLQAGAVLEVLLDPFRNDDGENLEQDLLADELGGWITDSDLFDQVGDDELFGLIGEENFNQR